LEVLSEHRMGCTFISEKRHAIPINGSHMPRYPEPAGDSRLTAPRVVSGDGYSQTLSRGLYLLELMAASAAPATLTELAEVSGFGTTVTHRLLRTLAAHRLVTQRPGGGYTLGFGLVTLTRRVALGLADQARPVLHRAAEDLGTTVFLGVADGDDLVCFVSVQPTQPDGFALSYREGLRHPITKGASGRAILAARPRAHDEPPEVSLARRRGYAHSANELSSGVTAFAVAIPGHAAECSLSVTALFLGAAEPERVTDRLRQAAKEIAATEVEPIKEER
jgi:DNA-binding IclR family transcriptional regulator